jgi:NAD(P)H-quinone oxidoreductase subunit 5
MNSYAEVLPQLMIALPLFAAAWLALSSIVLGSHTENRTTKTVSLTMICTVILSFINLWLARHSINRPYEVFTWHQFGHESFTFELYNSLTDAMYACCYTLIIGIVGRFSHTYLHREPSFFTYYYLYLLFVAATNLVIFSANFPSLLVGWELVGICSILLIGFFHHRSGPLANSLYTMISYRIGEACLLLAITIAHSTTGSSSFSLFNLHHPANHLILAAVICAIYVKAAQWPFSLWLPRAMEGPTPSSAMLYGGISTHMGPMLLIKLMPYLDHYPWVSQLVTAGSIFTITFASGIGRMRCDAKTQVAYATIGQLGLIFFEIGMGWCTLAFFHSLSHCALRTFQFLKTPSMLAEHTQLQLAHREFSLERLFPLALRRWLYYAAQSQFFLDTLVALLLLRPFARITGIIALLEAKISGSNADTDQTQVSVAELPSLTEDPYVISSSL